METRFGNPLRFSFSQVGVPFAPFQKSSRSSHVHVPNCPSAVFLGTPQTQSKPRLGCTPKGRTATWRSKKILLRILESETGPANRGTAIVPLSTIGTRYGNSVSTPRASKTNGTTRPQLNHHGRESKRKADAEIQCRPRIVDTDIDCGARFCGPRFRDFYRRFLGRVLGKGSWKGSEKGACYGLHSQKRSGVAPANQTKKRSVHELFAGAFRNKSSM